MGWFPQCQQGAGEGVALSGGCSARSDGGGGQLPPAWGCPYSRSASQSSVSPPASILISLAAWPLRVGIPAAAGRLRLGEGLIFPGFDVLIPQRSCSLRLRSAAASPLRFPHLPLCCHVRLRPWLDEETRRRLTSPSRFRGALTAAGACGAGAAALGFGCLPQPLVSLNA